MGAALRGFLRLLRRLEPCRVLLATSITPALLACSANQIEIYRNEMRLSAMLSSATPVIGESVFVTYTMKNTGENRIVFCLGAAEGSQIVDQKGQAAGFLRIADHAECLERFDLAPGAAKQFTRTISLPDKLTPGKAIFSGYLQVVAPDSCRREHGCSAIRLSTGLTKLEIIAAGESSATRPR